jgi:hypothetical protein
MENSPMAAWTTKRILFNRIVEDLLYNLDEARNEMQGGDGCDIIFVENTIDRAIEFLTNIQDEFNGIKASPGN